MPQNSAYLAFLRDPEQDQRRAELAAFFGPHADIFLKQYNKLQSMTTGNTSKFQLFGGGFEVAAFFLGPVWFFYRKMWTFAWFVVGLLVVTAFVPLIARLGLVVGIILATMAHRTYVQHAITKLQALRRPDGSVDMAAVADAGGVSRQAGAISGTVYGLLVLLSIFGIVYAVMHGIDPHTL